MTMGDSPSILLLGMRGAGKTTLARLCASHLSIPFLDADSLFNSVTSLTPPAYVAQHGWPAFRSTESAILISLLTRIKQGEKLVISLGGGVVEEESNRVLLEKFWKEEKGVVIHVFREVGEWEKGNDGTATREPPKWRDGGMQQVWERRKPWFRQCSSHEFVNFTNAPPPTYSQPKISYSRIQSPSSSLILPQTEFREGEDEESKARIIRMEFEQVERDFIQFFRRILPPYMPSPPPRPFTSTSFSPSSSSTPPQTQRTYLVTLPFPSLLPHISSLSHLTTGASAVELRLDLLKPLNGDSITLQIGLLRRHAPGIPVIVSLRSTAQGGRWSGPPSEAYELLLGALKAGVEGIDLELPSIPPLQSDQLLPDHLSHLISLAQTFHNTTIILSYRSLLPPDQGGLSWSGVEFGEKWKQGKMLGADIVKLVGTAGGVDDNFLLRVFAASELIRGGTEGKKGQQPLLSAYNMSPHGRISRFLNPVLASVTHQKVRKDKDPRMKGIVGTPSMTFKEVMMALHLSGLLEGKGFIVLDRENDEKGKGRALDEDEDELRGRGEIVRYLCERSFVELGLPFEIEEDLINEEAATSTLRWKDHVSFARKEAVGFGGVVLILDEFGESSGGEQDEVEMLEIMEMMDELTDEAKQVEGVDAFVVIPGEGGKEKGLKGRLRGDCIFTKTLENILETRLSPSNAISPSSFALVLSSPSTSRSPTPPNFHSIKGPSQSRSLQTRSIMITLEKLGINQITIADPLVDNLEEIVGTKIPGIIICAGSCEGWLVHDEHEDEGWEKWTTLLTSFTGGVVIDLSTSFPKESINPITVISRDEPHSRRGWITLSREEVDDYFARELFRFWTGTRAPVI